MEIAVVDVGARPDQASSAERNPGALGDHGDAVVDVAPGADRDRGIRVPGLEIGIAGKELRTVPPPEGYPFAEPDRALAGQQHGSPKHWAADDFRAGPLPAKPPDPGPLHHG